jgi:short-subunit dehydrogenase
MPVVIVTGASSGIGRAIALRLGRPGSTIVLAARRTVELAEVSGKIAANGGTALAVPTDVRDPEQITALIAQAGPVDVLINNAGVGGSPSILAADGAVTAMLDINVLAPTRLMRAVVPQMRERGAGSIINIGSVAGEIGISGTYSATKFALRGLTDSVRRELAGTGIGVTLIEPGHIATELTGHRKKHMPGPEIVADAVERALRRPRRRMVVPVRYRFAMVAAGALPQLTDRMYAGKAARRS